VDDEVRRVSRWSVMTYEEATPTKRTPLGRDGDDDDDLESPLQVRRLFFIVFLAANFLHRAETSFLGGKLPVRLNLS